ncbi:hypothetical protein [Flavobacterium selenitireducens]|uniref:hypothetical protein n=1 Tax=Flavobacterium selenitireducens TaxID=2722704 RepID=UPI00168AB735|nr:hypothetical protein [Flavobacterium selenitireducens]MBD3581932.1 hypothetical protein [Flavobacterium selenitireducens]
MRTSTQFTAIIVFFLSFLVSCQFNSTNSNREQDKVEAEAVSENFFKVLSTKDYAKTLPFFSENFFAVATKDELLKFYARNDSILGDMQERKLREWNTTVVSGTNPRSEYVLVYDIKRTNYMSEEIVTLEKEQETIKILGYRVNSEAYNPKTNKTAAVKK